MDLPYGKRAIGTKWVYRNKKDERGIVIRNKARLVAQGYTQEEGINYDEVFAPVARIEAIRLFLAYDSFKDFVVYQIDVKCAFLYGKIEEEVYVCQPLGFEDPEFPNIVYKVENALYGLHQAPRAWYETLSTYLFDNGFQKGQIDNTLFIKRVKSDILLVQVYVNDIIFGSTKKELCTEFEKLMHKKFQMSSMTSTPMETSKPLMKDENAKDVDVHLYRSMIGSLMYLTSSRPDIMFDVCACARFQVTPKVSHLHVVKRIFRYLKGQPKLGLWYSKDSPFNLEAYNDNDYASVSLDRKSTTGGCQFLRSRLISWQCKKQTVVANSTTEAEYVAVASCCGQFWETATARTLDNGEIKLTATIDSKVKIVTKAFVRRHLQLADFDGTSSLPTTEIFEQLSLMGQVRRRAKIVIFDDKDDLEDPSKQGRNIDKIDQDPGISLVQHDAAIQGRYGQDMEFDLDVSTVEPVSTAGAAVTTASVAAVSTASPTKRVSIADDITMAEILMYIRKSASKDKGKGKMDESASTNQDKVAEEERQMIARIHEATSSFNVEEWEDIQARVEADEELTQRLQAVEKEMYTEAKQARMLVELINQRKKYFAAQRAEERRNKPPTQAQQRTYISNYIKHMGSHTL
ncbi:putative ribonuclease H-like domain-containing protein [Tanacetum coccineum]